MVLHTRNWSFIHLCCSRRYIQVTSLHKWKKQGINHKYLIGNRFHVTLRIVSPIMSSYSIQALQVETEMKNLNIQVTLLVQKGVGTPFPPHHTPGKEVDIENLLKSPPIYSVSYFNWITLYGGQGGLKRRVSKWITWIFGGLHRRPGQQAAQQGRPVSCT